MSKILKPKRDVYYRKKINSIINTVQTVSYPPVYDPQKWKDKKTNCYGYALDIDVDDEAQYLYFPGCLSDLNADLNIYGNLTEKLKKDLDFLNISYRDNSNELSTGEYRIAIYYRPTPHDFPIGFHLARQDRDGRWSEKPSWTNPVHIIQEESTENPPNLEEHQLYLETVLIISK